MSFRDKIINNANIRLSILSLKSYVREVNLLELDDIELFYKLQDHYNEEIILDTIAKCEKKLSEVLDEDEFFQIRVLFKLKSKNPQTEQIIYRPIHTADLITQICIIAILNVYIYRNVDDQSKTLSDLCQQIPANFFGNCISRNYNQVYMDWRKSYSSYSQTCINKYFEYRQSGKYSKKVCLDIQNFYPSIDPQFIYNKIIFLLDNYDNQSEMRKPLKKILYFQVQNLNNQNIKYYCSDEELIEKDGNYYNKGLPQGLPQADFFAHFAMLEIAKIFESELECEGYYYVDDSVLFTNRSIKDTNITDINDQINNIINLKLTTKCSILEEFDKYNYSLKIHELGGAKSSIESMDEDSESSIIYLREFALGASNVSIDVNNTSSSIENDCIESKLSFYLDSVNKELIKKPKSNERTKLLVRYKKFFQYRLEKIKQLTKINNDENFYKFLTKYSNIEAEDFFNLYDENAFQAVAQIYINEATEANAEKFIDELKKLESKISDFTNTDLSNLYFHSVFKKYNFNINLYDSLKSVISKRELSYLKVNTNIRIEKLKLISNEYIYDLYKPIVRTNEHLRKYINACISNILSVDMSDDIKISKLDNHEITYRELRILVYIRNHRCDNTSFWYFLRDILYNNHPNDERIDYTIFEILEYFLKYVKDPLKIDILIRTHQYVSSIWRNGAKFPYFYTIHNQEHSIELIKLSVKILKHIDYFHIDADDYFALFLSCYLHDISMVEHPNLTLFQDRNMDSDAIFTEFLNNYRNVLCDEETQQDKSLKKLMVNLFNDMSNYYDNLVRVNHAQNSASIIRYDPDFCFIDKTIRESVAQISEAHSYDRDDVYFLKSDAKHQQFSLKYIMIILRLADLLDVTRSRVSKNLLLKSAQHMNEVSLFHWISHLAIEKVEFYSKYSISDDELKPFSENIFIEFYLNHSDISPVKKDTYLCKGVNCKFDGTIDQLSIVIDKDSESLACSNCFFLCKWMMKKNEYLQEELRSLQNYINSNIKYKSFHVQFNIIFNICNKRNDFIPQNLIDKVREYIK